MSEHPNWRIYIDDMIRYAERAQKYTAGLSQEKFVSDELVYDATLRNLELIGEAAGKIPDVVQEVNPEIPWRIVKRFRNHLAHEYNNVDDDIVWDVITSKIPGLIDLLKQLDEPK